MANNFTVDGVTNTSWTKIVDSIHGIIISEATGISTGTLYILAVNPGDVVGPDRTSNDAMTITSSSIPKKIEFEGVKPVALWARTNGPAVSIKGYILWSYLAKPTDASRTTLLDEESEIFDTSYVPTKEWKDFRSQQIFSYTDHSAGTTSPYPIVPLIKRVLLNGKKVYNNIVSRVTYSPTESKITYTLHRQGIDDGVDVTSTGVEASDTTFDIPALTTTTAGLVTSGVQTIAGAKTLTSTLTVSGSGSDLNLTYGSKGFNIKNTGVVKSSGIPVSLLVDSGNSVYVSAVSGSTALSTLYLLGQYGSEYNQTIVPNSITSPLYYESSTSSRTDIKTLYGGSLSLNKGTSLGDKINLLDRSSPKEILSSVTLTAASADNSGIITTGTQAIAGAKTFNNDVTFKGATNISGTSTVESIGLHTDGTTVTISKSGDDLTVSASDGGDTSLIATNFTGLASSASKVTNSLSIKSSNSVGDKTYDGSSAVSIYSPNQIVNSGSDVTFGTVTAALTGTASNALALNNKADSAFIHTSGNESMSGTKTFSGVVKITDTTDPTAAGAGALVMSGGLYAPAAYITNLTSPTLSSTTGTVATLGSTTANIKTLNVSTTANIKTLNVSTTFKLTSTFLTIDPANNIVKFNNGTKDFLTVDTEGIHFY